MGFWASDFGLRNTVRSRAVAAESFAMSQSDLSFPETPAPPAASLQFPDGPAAAVEACWSESGVSGSRRCPKLERFVHCHNCPVHSSAGAQLLNRALPAGYRFERTAQFAAGKQLREGRTHSALIFRLGTEWLALPTQVFQEVAERRPIHSLPHRRQGLVLGLASVRGELLLAVSLGNLLGLQRTPAPGQLVAAGSRLLVTHWQGQRLVFLVNEVCGPHRFDSDQLQAPPATLAKAPPAYTRGVLPWQQRAVGVLDAELVFAALNRRLL